MTTLYSLSRLLACYILQKLYTLYIAMHFIAKYLYTITFKVPYRISWYFIYKGLVNYIIYFSNDGKWLLFIFNLLKFFLYTCTSFNQFFFYKSNYFWKVKVCGGFKQKILHKHNKWSLIQIIKFFVLLNFNFHNNLRNIIQCWPRT